MTAQASLILNFNFLKTKVALVFSDELPEFDW